VFAIPTARLWDIIRYKEKGLIPGNSAILNSIVQYGIFRSRDKLENDSSFKQIIPYAIISFQGSYYLFRRSSGQREKRLHNKLSLGVGGHMNPEVSNDYNEQYVINELKREIFEELSLLNNCFIESIEFIGFINDDTIPVGTAHIGLLYDIRVSDMNLSVKETDKMSAEWVNKADLTKFYELLETWTKITFDYYIKTQAR